MEISVRGVNPALDELGHYLAVAGVEETSRNGPVLVSPEPVTLIYTEPRERVLFSPLRDANPWLHFMESLGFLAGRADVDWYAYFAKRMRDYSDDGKELYGSYGRRWRSWFGYDQLDWIVLGLQCNPNSRREVLTMWDPGSLDDNEEPRVGSGDLYVGGHGGRDVPCNTHAYFDLRGGSLNMTVLNRSNDALWGMLGANAVHFSVLLEYMAAWLKVPVGRYVQFSNNVHVYPANLPRGETVYSLAVDAGITDAYRHDHARPFPLVNTDLDTWDRELEQFMAYPSYRNFEDVFFSTVALPMYAAWKERKEKRGSGLDWARLIAAPDWRRACVEWILRREAKKEKL